MASKVKPKRIGKIGNYYGGLHVTEHNGKYYWCIENYDTALSDPSSWRAAALFKI